MYKSARSECNKVLIPFIEIIGVITILYGAFIKSTLWVILAMLMFILAELVAIEEEIKK